MADKMNVFKNSHGLGQLVSTAPNGGVVVEGRLYQIGRGDAAVLTKTYRGSELRPLVQMWVNDIIAQMVHEELTKMITEQYLADPASVDATLGQTALSIAARNGDAALFDRLQKLFETSTNPELQQGALSLLAQFTNPALTVRALDYAASGKVRNQDTARQFGIALQLSETREQAWKYIQSHWDQVQAQVSPQMLTRVVASTGSFCTQSGRDSVKDFFTTHKVPAANISLKHALEHIDGCIELRTLQEPNLNKWLAALPK